MKFQIVADGKLMHGTRIVNAETGEPIKGVRGLTFNSHMNHANQIILDLIPEKIEMVVGGALFIKFAGKLFRMVEVEIADDLIPKSEAGDGPAHENP